VTRFANDISEVIVRSALVSTITPIASAWTNKLELTFMELTLDFVGEYLTFLKRTSLTKIIITNLAMVKVFHVLQVALSAFVALGSTVVTWVAQWLRPY